jgi:hypothetical protein
MFFMKWILSKGAGWPVTVEGSAASNLVFQKLS